MFLGLGNERDRNQSFGTCWVLLEVGYKFILITYLTFSVLSLFLGGFLAYYFANLVELTIGKFQIWRLITSFMFPGSIISGFFDMWILYQFMPDMVNS